MGIFANITDVDAENGSSKNEYPKDGEYIVEIDRHVYNPATRNGDTLAIVEFTVLEVLREEFNTDGTNLSHNKGARVAWFNKLSVIPRGPEAGKLTEQGERGMKRLKGYLMQALGGAYAGVTEDMVTPKVAANAFGIDPETEEPLGPDADRAFAGIKLRVRFYTVVSKKSGKPFTNAQWAALDPEADE